MPVTDEPLLPEALDELPDEDRPARIRDQGTIVDPDYVDVSPEPENSF